MSQIWKYEIRAITDVVELSMPVGAEVLTVQVQRGMPCIWARVNPAAPRVLRMFRIVGTGYDLPVPPWPCRLEYMGTFQMHDGNFVWHVFQEIPQ